MLVLQQSFEPSNEEVEFKVKDRLTFAEFAGLGVIKSIPVTNTVDFFRECRRKADVID